MTHFFGIVLVPCDTPDLYAAVQKAMEQYDENRAVPSYRFYPDAEEIRRMREWYKTDDLRQLARYAYEWDGDESGDVDENGRLYFMSRRNPEGKWDYWLIGGSWYGEMRKKLVDFRYESDPLPDERERMMRDNSILVRHIDHTVHCRVVVTPDGSWHQYDESWVACPSWQTASHDAVDEEDERLRTLWYADVDELLRHCTQCIAIGLDIHR